MHSFFYYLCTIKLKKCMAKNLLNKYVWLEMTYQSFVHDEANTFLVEPYCLKAFKQRWYLVARSPYYDKIMIYALVRVRALEKTDDCTPFQKSAVIILLTTIMHSPMPRPAPG